MRHGVRNLRLASATRLLAARASLSLQPITAPRLSLATEPATVRHHVRAFSLSSIHPVILAPCVFVGLALSLWSYKCLMMVLFQNRILYMPGIPFGSRREELPPTCDTLPWSFHLHRLKNSRHSLAVVTTTHGTPAPTKSHTVILYFQGNAASPPPRIPELSRVLKALDTKNAHYTFLYPCYRGFWKSTGSPTYAAIGNDTIEYLEHVLEAYPDATRIVLWGQSIGCPILLHGLAGTPSLKTVDLVLETPFTSTMDMIPALWPERWLPYHYLGPFLVSRWDGVRALGTAGAKVRRCLVVRAEKDEIVPEEVGRKMEDVVMKLVGGEKEIVVVKGALHTMAVEKRMGREAVSKFLNS